MIAITDITGLITPTQVTTLIGYLAIVFGGIIGLTLIVAPFSFAKTAFEGAMSKISALVGMRG